MLDEPTVGLDPLLRRELWATFHALAAEGTTLLVSSHVMDEAERCDDLVLLRDGRVLATGTPSELLERAAAPNLDAGWFGYGPSTRRTIRPSPPGWSRGWLHSSLIFS